MRFFVKLNGNFTSTFFSDHGRLVVVKANFKIITSRTNILHVALLTCNQVDDILDLQLRICVIGYVLPVLVLVK